MKIWFTLIISALCIIPCAAQKSETDLLITIERQGCFGSCPEYSAQVDGNGKVIYRGKNFVKITGEEQYQIPRVRIERLLEEFDKHDYFSLRDDYYTDENGLSSTDLPTTITSITKDGKKKRVVNYLGAPKRLIDLEDMIEFLADLNFRIGPL